MHAFRVGNRCKQSESWERMRFTFLQDCLRWIDQRRAAAYEKYCIHLEIANLVPHMMHAWTTRWCGHWDVEPAEVMMRASGTSVVQQLRTQRSRNPLIVHRPAVLSAVQHACHCDTVQNNHIRCAISLLSYSQTQYEPLRISWKCCDKRVGSTIKPSGVGPGVADILSLLYNLYFSLLHFANSRDVEIWNLAVAKPMCSVLKFVAVLA